MPTWVRDHTTTTDGREQLFAAKSLFMPEAETDALLADLTARGGSPADLQQLPPSELTAALKALGYGKLGERARVIQALKDAGARRSSPVELEAPSDAAPAPAASSVDHPAAASDGDATLTADSTMVSWFDSLGSVF